MRVRLHQVLTILLNVIGIIAGVAGAIAMLIVCMNHGWPKPAPFIALAVLLTGFFLPNLIMFSVPAICPVCGGRVTYKLTSWAFVNSLIPKPIYAWSCASCAWTTYRWGYGRKKGD